MTTMLIAGASRGIGAAVAAHFAVSTETLYSVSRSRSPHGEWIEADLASQGGIDAVADKLGDTPLDALLYTGGIWEAGAFTDEYRFDSSSMAEIDAVIAVNLTAPIKLVRALLTNLRKAEAPRVVMIGALRSDGDREVANTASKHGLAGAAQAMKCELRKDRIGVTVINPGNVATNEVIEDIETGAFGPQTPIPMTDLISAIDWALSLSAASVATEINLAQIDA